MARRDDGAASKAAPPLSERIGRYLARAGIASRRHADDLVEQGRVRINGRAAVLGEKVVPGVDRVLVDGREVRPAEPPVYILLNKPQGYLSTCADPFGRRTVLSLLKGVDARVFPVGRLDLDADGLLLMTNDGDLAYLLTHPKHHVVKEYVVLVAGEKDDKKIRDIQRGIIVDGKKVDVDYARFLEPQPGLRLLIGVHEGEKHLVKNICAEAGYRVLRLTRTRMGGLALGDLPQGKWRRVTEEEIRSLKNDARRGWEGERDGKRKR